MTLEAAMKQGARSLFAMYEEGSQIFNLPLEDLFPATTAIPVEIDGTTYYIKMTVELHKEEE